MQSTHKISIILPTNRPGGLEHAKASLPRQTFQDFEVLVGSPFEPGFGRWVPDDFKGGFWTLNRTYNRLYNEARGELVVTLQDFIWVPPDGLERFWNTYERTRGLVTGIGDQYDRVGLDGSHDKACWHDPRKGWTGFAPIGSDSIGKNVVQTLRPLSHEWNWASLPKSAILAAGGMDEEMDFIGFGCDNTSAVERMFEMGYPFYIDFANEVFCQQHGRVLNWEKHHTLYGNYSRRKNELQKTGNWPVLTDSAKLPSRYRSREKT